MCGITLTTVSRIIKNTNRINPDIFKNILKNKTHDEKLINLLYQLAFNYKSDINFINYFQYKVERNKIKSFVKNVKKKINQFKIEDQEKILDIEWFLDYELVYRFNFVKKIISTKKVSNHSIIFFKVLHSVINSINLLETRGRDSLGLFFSITLNKNTKNLELAKKISSNKKYSFSIDKKKITLNLVYKTFNIFGSLGENSEKVLNEIKKDKNIFNLFLEGNFEHIIIAAHTRWASVGSVNLMNTHPVIEKKIDNSVYAFMNGDIQNYKNFIKSKKVDKSDAFALSNLFINHNNFNNKKQIKKIINQIKGSFTGIIYSQKINSEILLIRKGSMGLFKGKNNDRIYFSSDVYGLVEDCQDSIEFKKDSFSILNLSLKKTKLSNYQTLLNTNRSFFYKKYENNIITRRDLAKKNYKFFLEKEINESADITNKTINNYLNNNIKKNFFNEKNFLDIQKIIKKIKLRKISKIILVGMGTCHTAAEAISGYMKEKLNKFPNIAVKALVSSEASAFYLEKNMKDTLIIAIAQSGTTKDTNVFIEMSNLRGATTLCLLNKRNGDISYLCDSTLYLGNGRDIEISVPSTKTYIAHIVLGYILTNYLHQKIYKPNSNNIKRVKNEIKEIKKIPLAITQTLKNFSKFSKKINYKKIIKKKKWYVAYDNQNSFYAGSEIRIKLSECCYKTLPCVDINDLDTSKIYNSIIIMIKDNLSNENNKIIENISKINSLMILIGQKNELSKIKKTSKIIKIINPNLNKAFNVIPSVINGQLLSFNIAKELNKRSLIFSKIIKNNSLAKLDEKKFNNYISENIDVKKIITLKKNIKKITIKNTKLNSKIRNELIFFEQFMRRPIDTIKHQAKTITVGTDRKTKNKTICELKTNLHKFENFKQIIDKDKFKKINFNLRNNCQNIYLYSENSRDPLINFVYSYVKYLKKNISFFPEIHLNKENKIKDFSSNFIDINLVKKENLISHIKIINNLEQKINLDTKYYSNFIDISDNNFYFKNILDLFGTLNTIVFNLIDKSQIDLFLKNLNNFYYQILESISFYNKSDFSSKILKIKKIILTKDNIKFIGGGSNYFVSAYLSKLINQNLSKSSGFDVLENHKHIDMSAEPFLFTLITNCPNLEYFSDFISEIEKFISHNNLPAIITDRYDIKKNKGSILNNLNMLKIPQIQKEINLIIYLKLFENLYLKKKNHD
ncbi:SIS domain-containing protein [Candidatus Pelagibacter sp.]|nr:SIS domain-containing protein [Candidatus Pelagibacter sp.]